MFKGFSKTWKKDREEVTLSRKSFLGEGTLSMRTQSVKICSAFTLELGSGYELTMVRIRVFSHLAVGMLKAQSLVCNLEVSEGSKMSLGHRYFIYKNGWMSSLGSGSGLVGVGQIHKSFLYQK